MSSSDDRSKPTGLGRKSIVETVPVQSLDGVVYGPEGTPLCDAVVRLLAWNRSTRTGSHGEFNFETVPPSNLGSFKWKPEAENWPLI
jgi:hypothetical protein